jgi:hypothetical protein
MNILSRAGIVPMFAVACALTGNPVYILRHWMDGVMGCLTGLGIGTLEKLSYPLGCSLLIYPAGHSTSSHLYSTHSHLSLVSLFNLLAPFTCIAIQLTRIFHSYRYSTYSHLSLVSLFNLLASFTRTASLFNLLVSLCDIQLTRVFNWCW